MNKYIKFLVAITFLSMSGLGFAAAGDMAGGPHDLTSIGVNGELGLTGETNLCAYCHTPHNANNVFPLWDRATPAGPFTEYTNPGGTMNGTAAVGGISLGCLSCHDGVTAFDAVGGAGGSTVMSNVTIPGTTAIVGEDLSNDHPIGMALVGDPAVVATEAALDGTGIEIFAGNVECASCHDVHELPGNMFLRVTDGTLCQTCHLK